MRPIRPAIGAEDGARQTGGLPSAKRGGPGAARRFRRAGALALSLWACFGVNAKADALAYEDFSKLVSACVQETSLNHTVHGAIVQLAPEVGLRPLAPSDEPQFAKLTVPLSLASIPSLLDMYLEGTANKPLDEHFSDPEVLKRREEYVHTVQERDLTQELWFDPELDLLDEKGRKRHFWWFNTPGSVAVTISTSLLGRYSSFSPLCAISNVPNEWAEQIFNSADYRFAEASSEALTVHSARIETKMATARLLYKLVTGLGKRDVMPNAEIRLIKFNNLPPALEYSNAWVLTVTALPDS